MQKSTKKIKYDDARSLLRQCFRNPLFTQVPFDIWKVIVYKTTEETARTIATLAQASKGFKEVARQLQTTRFSIAKMYRKEGQIRQAKKYIEECVNSGNLEAKHHFAYALLDGGWGFEKDKTLAGILFLDLYQQTRLYIHPNTNSHYVLNKDEIEKSLLTSGDSYAIGEYYRIFESLQKAIPHYEIAAKQGNEFAQWRLGAYHLRFGKLIEGVYWYQRSAEQGFAAAQFDLAEHLSQQYDFTQNGPKVIGALWMLDATKQNHFGALKKWRSWMKQRSNKIK